jgi:hypothetical protein
MTNYQLYRQLDSSSPDERVTGRKGRLRIDLPVSSFQTAFANFNEAAHAFAMSLSDSLDRRFAYRYVGYLQDIARGSEELKRLYANGRPNCRLITAELDRLFRCHFFRPSTSTRYQADAA